VAKMRLTANMVSIKLKMMRGTTIICQLYSREKKQLNMRYINKLKQKPIVEVITVE
tara:strand:+ start:687 stop:854 length:168 start_codon:yes stop_codon:yes gene_type:complete